MSQAGGSQLVAAKYQLDKIYGKKMPSTGVQNLVESI